MENLSQPGIAAARDTRRSAHLLITRLRLQQYKALLYSVSTKIEEIAGLLPIYASLLTKT